MYQRRLRYKCYMGGERDCSVFASEWRVVSLGGVGERQQKKGGVEHLNRSSHRVDAISGCPIKQQHETSLCFSGVS